MQRFENKYDLLNAAYKDKALKKGTIALLQYLVYKSNKMQCFPAVDTIANALGCCRRTIQYNMRKLERAGYIIRKDRWYNHQQLSNQYVFNFGITEEGKGEAAYTDKEYSALNDNSLFNIPKKYICKLGEIRKIYGMGLKTREKMLLIYLCHKANKTGRVYVTFQAFMDAVGMRKNVLVKLLNSLRNKGLLKIKYMVLRNSEHLVMQITGECWQYEEEVGPAENIYEELSARRQGMENIVQNIQKNLYQEAENHGKNIQKKRKGNFLKCLMSYVKGCFASIKCKIKEILRL